MFNGTKIKEKINPKEFVKLISSYNKEQIGCTSHTFFRLSHKQREIFTCEDLKKILINEKPFFNRNSA